MRNGFFSTNINWYGFNGNIRDIADDEQVQLIYYNQMHVLLKCCLNELRIESRELRTANWEPRIALRIAIVQYSMKFTRFFLLIQIFVDPENLESSVFQSHFHWILSHAIHLLHKRTWFDVISKMALNLDFASNTNLHLIWHVLVLKISNNNTIQQSRIDDKTRRKFKCRATSVPKTHNTFFVSY